MTLACGIAHLRAVNRIVLFLLLGYGLLVPAWRMTVALTDVRTVEPGVSPFAAELFASLTPRYEAWARARIAGKTAAALSTENISGTEWPLFGSVFFLWATEALQEAWHENPAVFAREPKVFARGAVAAAADLVLDESHAGWVRRHWGEQYLVRENVFYRALRLAAFTARVQLLDDHAALAPLRKESAVFRAELDASPYGVLDDYPGECYPGDVLMALMVLRRADAVLGEEHAAFYQRARRAFRGRLLDAQGLVPYSAFSREGRAADQARGCGNAYVSLCAPQLWPEDAARWYAGFARHFWQERAGIAGFREFYPGVPRGEWYLDVDSGPVVGGFGVAASAFGLGAARVNGRFDHAKALTGEMIATSWPLWSGTLLLPRALSDGVDAPYLGEAAILYNLTRQPAAGVAVVTGGAYPWYVFAVCGCFWLSALLGMGACLRQGWRDRGPVGGAAIPCPLLQAGGWGAGMALALFFAATGRMHWALIALLMALLLPRAGRRAQTRPDAPAPPVRQSPA